MKEWINVKLSDLGEIVGGATPSTKNEDYYGGDIAWLTPKDLSNYNCRYISRGERNITKIGLKSCSAKLIPKNSVLFTSRAPIGYVAISSNEVATNQGFKSIIPNEDTDFLFLYYLLKYNKNKIESMGSGTTFKEVSGTVMKNFEVCVPKDKMDQILIGKILSSLDDKIELNARINNVLEETARALFHRWFVEFEFPDKEGRPYKSSGGKMVESEMGLVPEEWSVGTLGDIARITMGQSPCGKSYNEAGIGEVFYQGRAEFGERFPTRRLFTNEPKRMAEKGDVLISVRAPVGDFNIASEKCCIGRGIAAIHAKNSKKSFLLYTVMNLKRFLDVFNGEGTVFGSIGKDSLHAMPILIPSHKIIDTFEKIGYNIDLKIQKSYFEIGCLIKIRDSLLPKLMNGDLSKPLSSTNNTQTGGTE